MAKLKAIIAVEKHIRPAPLRRAGRSFRAMARCGQAGIWLLSDETYADLTFDGLHVSLAALQAGAAKAVAMSSFSKVLSILGFRYWAALARLRRSLTNSALSNSTLYFRAFPVLPRAGCIAGLSVPDAHAAEVRLN